MASGSVKCDVACENSLLELDPTFRAALGNIRAVDESADC